MTINHYKRDKNNTHCWRNVDDGLTVATDIKTVNCTWCLKSIVSMLVDELEDLRIPDPEDEE